MPIWTYDTMNSQILIVSNLMEYSIGPYMDKENKHIFEFQIRPSSPRTRKKIFKVHERVPIFLVSSASSCACKKKNNFKLLSTLYSTKAPLDAFEM